MARQLNVQFGHLEWWIYLTREEWQALFAVSASLEANGALPTPPFMHMSFENAAQYLVREHGATFVHLHFANDGTMWSEEDVAPFPENSLWISMIAKGLSPDRRTHFPAAIQWLRQNCLDFPVEMVEEELDKSERDAAQVSAEMKAMPDEDRQQMRDWFQQQMADAQRARKEMEN